MANAGYTFIPLQYPYVSVSAIIGVNDAGEFIGYYDGWAPDVTSRTFEGSLGSAGNPVVTVQPLGFLPYAINDSGTIAGVAPVAGGYAQGTVIDNAGTLSPVFAVPGAQYTYPSGISNSGVVVGFYSNAQQTAYGLYDISNGVLTTLGLTGTNAAIFINNAGEMAGWVTQNGTNVNFTDINGTITDLNFGLPHAAITGINDAGVIVGNYNNGMDAFIDNSGLITTLSVPGAVFTQVSGINDSGEVVGDAPSYSNPDQFFIYKNGTYTYYTPPGEVPNGGVQVLGINNCGQVWGIDATSNGWTPFIATPADPGPSATDPAETVAEGHSLTLTAAMLATPGVVGDTLSLTQVSATLGSVQIVNGALVYTPGLAFRHLAPNATGHDSIRYTIADAYGDTTTGTIAVTVTNPATVLSGGPYGGATIVGVAGAEIITAYGWNNTITSKNGFAVINAGQGNATVTTGAGDAAITLGGYTNVVHGGDGTGDNVTLIGSQGNLTATLGQGNDTVTLGGYNNVVQAGNGNDTVTGGQGNDTVRLGSGNDTVIENGYSNRITTGNGNDTVVAGAGNATVTTGGGNDTITLTGWSNWLDAGTGNNAVMINGGGGGDTLVLHLGGTDEITGYGVASNDVFDLRAVLSEAHLSLGGDMSKLGTYLKVSNTNGNTTLTFEGNTLAVLHGVGASVHSLNDLVSHGDLRIA